MTDAAVMLVLDRHSVRYLSCPGCHFFRTEKPHWLAEAYSQSIAATDTGIVARNLRIARQLSYLLPELFAVEARFLDVAGGTGLLTRLMRDSGFDFYWEDLYCQNVLAFGFEATPRETGYAAVTAFEALEHMEQPYDFIKTCVERSTTGTLLFTTELFPSPLPPQNWWYFSRITGQHISFFSIETLQVVARQLGLRFMTHRGLHMLTRSTITEQTYRNMLDRESRTMVDQALDVRCSLTIADHKQMVARVLRAKGGDETQLLALIGDGLDPVPSNAEVRYKESGGWLQRTTDRWRRSVKKRLYLFRHKTQGER